MPSLAGFGPGFYETYRQRTAENQNAGLKDLQGIAQVMQIKGAMQRQQEAAQEQQRDNALREAIAKLPPDQRTSQNVLPLIKQYGKPMDALKLEEAMKSREHEQNLRAQMAQDNLAIKQQQLDLSRDQFMQRTTDAAARQQFEEFYKRSQLQLQGERDKLNADLKRMGLDLQRQGMEMKQDMAQEKRQQAGEKNVQQLGTALERANLPEADAVLKTVEEALSRTPDLASYLSGPKSLMPDMIVPQEIRAGRQAAQRLFNITLKDRSGAAVTIPELERLKQEFATGAFKTPDQFKEGVKQARRIVSEHYRGVAASFGPDVLKAYNENLRSVGGTPLLEGSSPAPAVPAAPSGGPVIDFGSLK